MPPVAGFSLPWDDAEAPDPVVALAAARAELGETFIVDSGRDRLLFVFSPSALRDFYGLAERVASKGLADYRMLLRKLPHELFADRRTFAHDLFGAQEVEGYLGHLDTAIGRQLDELGDEGSFEVFTLARRLGHRPAFCWMGDGRVPPALPDRATSSSRRAEACSSIPNAAGPADRDAERASQCGSRGQAGRGAPPRRFLAEIARR
jgi:hypothetical protein